MSGASAETGEEEEIFTTGKRMKTTAMATAAEELERLCGEYGAGRRAEMFDARDGGGRTAADLARGGGHGEVIRALRAAGDTNAKRSSGGGCAIL